MFTSATDITCALAVWLFSGPSNRDEDFEGYVQAIARFDAEFADRDTPAAILVVDPRNPVPNAHWRRRIAEASRAVRPEVHFAMVTTSPLVRGVLTAVNWIQPPPYSFSAHATLDEAARAVKAHKGMPVPIVAELVEEARRKA